MKKHSIIGIGFVAALLLVLAACGTKQDGVSISGESITVGDLALRPGGSAGTIYENGGLRLVVPLEYNNLLNVDAVSDGGDNGILFSVAEKASVEAAKKQGVTEAGPGELFAIGRVSESELNTRRCFDMSGQETFARDGSGNYYIYYHPTDVRFTRESYESVGDENNEDWKQWSMLNEWANGKVRADFIAGNSNLTAVSYGNTDIDMFLARAAYASGESYTLGMPERASLSPNGVDAAPFVERLTSNVSFETANDGDMPEGEFVTIRFPEADYRFDFFLAQDSENYVRQIWNNEQNTMLYKACYSDGMTKAASIVKEWYDAVAANDIGNAAVEPPTDAAVRDLAGTWEEPGAFGGKNNTLTIEENGSFTLTYAAGGTRCGKIELLPEEHPDGSFSYWYAFYEQDGSLWENFGVPEQKPFDDIYSGQDGMVHFTRIKAGEAE